MKPRDPITEHHFPDKVSIEEFFECLFDEDEKNAFIHNMKHLKYEEPRYMEEWAHMFVAWKEMNLGE